MQYLICDDNKMFSKGLMLQLMKLEPNCSVKVYNSAEQLKFDLPDIASSTNAMFMDLKLANSCGIDEAVSILKQYPNIKVVYITGYPEKYSQEIFMCPPDIVPTAFLIKPIKDELLKNALERIREKDTAHENSFCIKNGHRRLILPADTILYISVLGRKVTVITHAESVEMNATLSECMEQLPDYFVQCHKSYCVNIRHIKEIRSRSEILITNGDTLPVGRKYVDSFRKTITAMYSELSFNV